MRGWRSAVLAALLLAAVWQMVVWTTGVQHFILPSPGRVLTAMWGNRVLIGEHAWVTLLEVLIGLAIGSALGIATAIYLSVSAAAQALLRPLLVFSQAIPVFALAPILTLWLGYGLWSKIAMAVLIIYFPVTSAFFDGLMRTPRGFMDLARTMDARPAAIMFRIRIPAALPALGTGLKLAAVYAPHRSGHRRVGRRLAGGSATSCCSPTAGPGSTSCSPRCWCSGCCPSASIWPRTS